MTAGLFEQPRACRRDLAAPGESPVFLERQDAFTQNRDGALRFPPGNVTQPPLTEKKKKKTFCFLDLTVKIFTGWKCNKPPWKPPRRAREHRCESETTMSWVREGTIPLGPGCPQCVCAGGNRKAPGACQQQGLGCSRAPRICPDTPGDARASAAGEGKTTDVNNGG